MFFDEKTVATKQKHTDKDEIIAFLVDKAYHAKKLSRTKNYIDAVYQREAEFSTAIGYGVAIPHGSNDDVIQSFVAVTTLVEPIMWNDSKVEMIFLIGVSSSNRTKEHLKILSLLARHLMHDEFRSEIMKAESNAELMDVLQKIEEELNV